MKKIILLVATLSTAMQMTTVYAAENQQPNKQSMNSEMPGSGMMEKGNMEMMKQNMHKMMQQMKKIHATNDPAERKQLMHDHMQNMQKNMKMMRGMGGGMMMGMTSDKMKGNKMTAKGMNSKDMGQSQQMMEQRMDMMQMMMEQMMGQMSEKDGLMPKSKKRHDHNVQNK